MTPLLLTFLTACLGDFTQPAVPPAPTYTDPALETTGASPAHPLHRMEGRYELPTSSRPEGSAFETSWLIPVKPSTEGVYGGRLPFSVGNPRGYPPSGIEVRIDGATLTYADKGKRRWSALRRDFWVEPATGDLTEVEVRWPDLQFQIDRHSFEASMGDLTAQEFVDWHLTIDGQTRTGLMLPAPATAEWDVTIPAQRPRFEAWLGLARTPLPDDVSDGATAVVEVLADGQTHQVGRFEVQGDSKRFQRFSVNLYRWAGKHVTVRLRTEPGATPWHDYLFWGSPTIWGAPEDEVRRIIVIGIDTTRPDHLGFYGYDLPTSPELDAFAATAAVFDNAWTPAPRTRPSFRSATTGRDPLMAVGSKNIGAVFQEHGFATAGIVANVHLQPRFGFHDGFDFWHYDNGAKAEVQVDRTLNFLRAHEDRDAYVFLHLLDPHIFYGAPGLWRNKFVTVESDLPPKMNRWAIYRKMAKGELGENDKAYLEQLYDGEIAYTSYQLGRFFHALDKMPGKSLVVIHSDHGEEFWEHGGFEHNHTLYADTTKALLVIRPGRGFQGGTRIDTPVTLKDIAPTLYDYVGFDAERLPEVDGKSLRPLIEGNTGEGWDRPLGIGHLRYGSEQWAVVHEDHKYVLHTGSGREEFYDLSADPGEQTDLAAERELGPWRRALADAHDMPVCDGIRIDGTARAKGELFSFQLPEPPLHVEILDPERNVEKPANQAWGLPPTRSKSEIGRIDWEPGSSRITWKPGTNPKDARIFVFYQQAPEPELVEVFHGNQAAPLDLKSTPYGHRWAKGGETLSLQRGTVISPPPGEAVRMRALASYEMGMAGGDDMRMLQSLGYIHGGDGHGHEDPDAPEPTPSGSPATPDSEDEPAGAGALTAAACRW